MDNGPWRLLAVTSSKFVIGSDDFTHDVVIEGNGDFADRAQKKAYAEWLLDKLNGVKRIADPRTESKREGVEL